MSSVHAPPRSDLLAPAQAMSLHGQWVHRDASYAVRDPEDGQTIAIVPVASAADAFAAIDTASAVRSTAAAMPSHERCRILHAAADAVEAEAEQHATLIAREGIKTIREARLEVARCVLTLRLSAAEATRQVGETIDFGLRPGSEHRTGYQQRVPVGVVVAITPFNDPLNLVAHAVGPAIAAGNSIIVKPHPRTPLSALRLAAAFERAGLPPGQLQVITGLPNDAAHILVADPRVRLVQFTGGHETGQRIAAAAGVKKLVLELGSNCPTIVMPDADVDRALAACVSGAFWAAGQNCLHVQRLYVHASLYPRFRDDFVSATRLLKLGRKQADDTDMGCLIDEGSAQRIAATVSSAAAVGARVLTGGTRCGTRFQPTVVENVSPAHELAMREIFGPVTVLHPFTHFDEAIDLANGTDYGLQAAIFTSDVNTAFRAVRELEAGAVMVNDSTDYRIDTMPFGGMKSSGIGRVGVQASVMEMTEPKVACFNLAGR